jgi:hypothetical protein
MLVAVFACGPDPRIAELEGEVDDLVGKRFELEHRVQVLEEQLDQETAEADTWKRDVVRLQTELSECEGPDLGFYIGACPASSKLCACEQERDSCERARDACESQHQLCQSQLASCQIERW